MKYIQTGTIKYVTNFTDELLSIEWKESELENDELKNYKAKAEYYIRQHQDNIVIAKLKTNKPLTSSDVASLEEILWKEVLLSLAAQFPEADGLRYDLLAGDRRAAGVFYVLL